MAPHLYLPLASLALVVTACTGNVAVDSGGTTSGSGGTTTTTSSTSTSTSTSSGCAGGSISLSVDDGAPVSLASSCAGAWNPSGVASAHGYVVQGGAPPGIYSLHVVGCASGEANSEGLDISLADATAPGKYTSGLIRYTDFSGSGWGYGDDPFEVKLTQTGALGEGIAGSFTGRVSHVMNGNAAHNLSGSFSVCHEPDENVP